MAPTATAVVVATRDNETNSRWLVGSININSALSPLGRITTCLCIAPQVLPATLLRPVSYTTLLVLYTVTQKRDNKGDVSLLSQRQQLANATTALDRHEPPSAALIPVVTCSSATYALSHVHKQTNQISHVQ